MQSFGPYLILDDQNKPLKWCCFGMDLTEDLKISNLNFYTADYSPDQPTVAWQSQKITQNSPNEFKTFYVYDTQTHIPSCYLSQEGKFYHVPLLAGNVANRVDELQLNKDGSSRWMPNPTMRARQYQIDSSLYHRLSNEDKETTKFLIPNLPLELQPQTVSEEPKKLDYPPFPIYRAHDLLQLARCQRVPCAPQSVSSSISLNEENNNFVKHSMDVWENESGSWCYQHKFRGTVRNTGKFDVNKDAEVILFLEKLQINQSVENTPEVGRIFKNLLRPIEILNTNQQALIVAALSNDWPLIAGFTPEQHRQICVALIQQQYLQDEILRGEAEQFRRLMFPSSIVELTKPWDKFYPATDNSAGSDTTIADIWRFVQNLLTVAAIELGQAEEQLYYAQPPTNNHILTSKYNSPEGTHQLLFTALEGLSEQLFYLVINFAEHGITGLTPADLKTYKQFLSNIAGAVPTQTYDQQEIASGASDYLLAAIAAQHGISHVAAKEKMTLQCKTIIEQITKVQIEQILKQYPEKNPPGEIWLDVVGSLPQLCLVYNSLSDQGQSQLLEHFKQYEDFLDVTYQYSEGKNLLHLTIDSPRLLQKSLNRLPTNQRLTAISQQDQDGDSALDLASGNPLVLKIILDSLSANDRFEAMKLQDQMGATILHKCYKNPNPLKIVLDSLIEEHRFEAIQIKNEDGDTVLHSCISSFKPDCLKILLDSLTEEHRFEAIQTKDEDGDTVLHGCIGGLPSCLKIILDSLTEEHRFEAIQTKVEDGDTVLHICAEEPGLIQIILNSLSENHLFEAIKLQNSAGNTVFHASSAYHTLNLISALIPKNQLLEVLKMRNAYGQTTLHYWPIHALQKVLTFTPEDQRLEFIKMQDNNGNTVLHNHWNYEEALKIILDTLPENQRLAAIGLKNAQGKTVIHLCRTRNNSLTTLLGSLPEHDRFAAVNEKDNDGNTILHLSCNQLESLQTILSSLPREQILEAVSERNNYGYTVLYQAYKQEIPFIARSCCFAILKAIPINQRLLAIKENNYSGISFRDVYQNPAEHDDILSLLPGKQHLITMLREWRSSQIDKEFLNQQECDLLFTYSELEQYCYDFQNNESNPKVSAARWLQQVLATQKYDDNEFKTHQAQLTHGRLATLFQTDAIDGFISQIKIMHQKSIKRKLQTWSDDTENTEEPHRKTIRIGKRLFKNIPCMQSQRII